MYIEKVLVPGLHELLVDNSHKYKNIFLVGGSVRDALLGVPSMDVDFVVTQGAPQLAKTVADFFHGAYYILDHARNTGRAIIFHQNNRFIIDFAQLRGNSIEEDLAARDFTINAMAIDLAEPRSIIDPLGAQIDLRNQVLRPCRPDAFLQDPIRTLRAVRFIYSYQLSYEISTADLITRSAPYIQNSSPERIRDELFHIFENTDIKSSLDLLKEFGLFNVLFPELTPLATIHPGTPHQHHVLGHTFRVMENVQVLYKVFTEGYYPDDNLFIRMALQELERFKLHLLDYVHDQINAQRTKLGLLLLAAMYHDSGKADSERNIPGESAPDRSLHADASAKLFMRVASKLALSNAEVDFVHRLIKYHMREELKTTAQDSDYAKQIYTYFKNTGSAGVLIVLMHLADLISTYEKELSVERWQIALSSAGRLLDGWFEKYAQWVNPPLLINGNDLIDTFNLAPGKEIGDILERIRLAQVCNEVVDRSNALKFAEEYLKGDQNS